MTTCGSQSQLRALRAVVGMALAVMMAAACESPGPPPTIRTQGTPLPKPRPGPPPVIAVHFDRGKYPLLGNRVADLAKVGQGCNAVLISSGDDRLVREARGQGLKVYLGFDEHKEFAAGKDITADVRDLVRFAQAHRHEIAGIRVADRVNQGLTPEQTLDYLRATGGVLHREVPGVPVVVDLSDPQLTCGLPGQDRCDKPRPGARPGPCSRPRSCCSRGWRRSPSRSPAILATPTRRPWRPTSTRRSRCRRASTASTSGPGAASSTAPCGPSSTRTALTTRCGSGWSPWPPPWTPRPRRARAEPSPQDQVTRTALSSSCPAGPRRSRRWGPCGGCDPR